MIGKACESAAGAFRRREAGRVGRPLITLGWVCHTPFPTIPVDVWFHRTGDNDTLRRCGRRCYEAPLDGRCVGDHGVDLVR